jgi:hypothetical protein
MDGRSAEGVQYQRRAAAGRGCRPMSSENGSESALGRQGPGAKQGENRHEPEPVELRKRSASVPRAHGRDEKNGGYENRSAVCPFPAPTGGTLVLILSRPPRLVGPFPAPTGGTLENSGRNSRHRVAGRRMSCGLRQTSGGLHPTVVVGSASPSLRTHPSGLRPPLGRRSGPPSTRSTERRREPWSRSGAAPLRMSSSRRRFAADRAVGGVALGLRSRVSPGSESVSKRSYRSSPGRRLQRLEKPKGRTSARSSGEPSGCREHPGARRAERHAHPVCPS